MYLIIGLGNPGTKYFNTRHNSGFMVIDKLAGLFKIRSFEQENHYLAASAEYNDNDIILMKPVTYMNMSGTAVREFFEEYEVQLQNTLIIYDDADLNFGTIRIKPSGSGAGQKGMNSIIYEMQTEEVPRLRIGIKDEEELENFKSEDTYDLAGYVLSDFTAEEKKDLDIIIEAAKDAVLSFIGKGIKVTMNEYNRNYLDKPESPEDPGDKPQLVQ
jgi:PTH1 family peptidyl-tRNA hydrolase